MNADPNYGALWFILFCLFCLIFHVRRFYAKRHPMDGTRHILANARSHLQRDLYRHRKVSPSFCDSIHIRTLCLLQVYQRALLRCQSSAVDERVADVGLGSAAWILLEEDGSQGEPSQFP